MLSTRKIRIPRASCPEQAGISSQAVMTVVKELEEINFEYHSMMILHNGVVAAELYRYPFSADMTHIMYSVSKNVTATALGFAIEEGKISLSTRVSDIFPDKYPSKRDDYFETTTIHNLVTMTAGKFPSYLLNKTSDDWFSHFSEAKRVAKPGEKFKYINECYYLLSACLRRVLGKGINDYLEPLLWVPLGIDKPFWETDHNGIEAGGWGLQMKLEDMVKLALCYLNKGVFDGKQIIPREWAEQAVLNQTPTGRNLPANNEAGYGYSVWRQGENSWRFDGMYGQTVQAYEDKGIICAINSGDAEPNRALSIFDRFAEAAIVEADEAAEPSEEYTRFISSRPIDVFEESPYRPELEKQLDGKTIRFGSHPALKAVGFPPGLLPPQAIFMSKDRAGNMNNIRFDFREDGCMFTWTEGDESNTVFCPMTGKGHFDRITLAQIPFIACSTAKWLEPDTLEVQIRPMQCVAKRILTFKFNGKRVKLTSSCSPSTNNFAKGIAGNVGELIKNPKFKAIVEEKMEHLDRVIEPDSTGIIGK